MAASYIHNDGQHSEVNVHQAKIPEEEILNAILRSANMEGAIFNHTVFSDSLYKAECIINISRVDAFQISGKTKIEGQLKNCPIDAENRRCLDCIDINSITASTINHLRTPPFTI
uniref:Uncharacterized protein n=1 Tax=Arundo donax TaxID=35708 RepID=A0A0A9D2Y3_ARUDO